jgi:hypothetical protein
MPLYDLFCTNEECGHEIIDALLGVKDDLPKCPKCEGETNRKCNCTHYKLDYNNRTDICDWAGNTSRYWDDIKKETSEGKNVVDPNADKWA